MKGFVRLSHFQTLLYLSVFLGLATAASTVTGSIIPIAIAGLQLGGVMNNKIHEDVIIIKLF